MPTNEMEPNELVQSKLNPFSADVWWREFIEKFYTIIGLDANNSTPTSYTNADGTTARPLYWTLLDVADYLKTDDPKKREKVLEVIVGDELGVPNFLFLLQEIAGVYPLNVKVSSIFRECTSQKNGNWRMLAVRSLLDRDYLSGFLTAITELCIAKKQCMTKKQFKETLAQTNINIFWAFSAVVQKDPKFGPKLCSLGQTRFLHRFIRDTLYSFSYRPEAHHPYLKILRFMSKSSNVSRRLARDGVMTTLRKILEKYNGPPTTMRQQIVLDIIVILTKSSRLNCKRFLKAGLLIAVMRIFGYCSIMKGRALSRMTKAVLNIYGRIVGTIYGKRALLNTDSLASVRKFAENCPSDKLLDETIFKACSVISQAHGKHKLPFKSLKCPLKFTIPQVAEVSDLSEAAYGSSSEDSDDEKHVGDGDDADDKDSDVEPEDALGTTTDEVDADSDESNIDIEQLLKLDLGSDTSISSTNNNDETQQSIPRFKVEKQQSKLPYIISQNQPDGDKERPNQPAGLVSQQSIDLFESVTRTVQTPLVKLIDFEHFFKEFENNTSSFDSVAPPEHISELESIIVGLLSESVPFNVNGSIPVSENKYAWKTEHKEYADLESMRKLYLYVAKKVHSIVPFVKIAYPDMTLAYHRKQIEQVVQSADRYTIRNKAIAIMGRAAGSILFKPKVVYDLDALIAFGGNPSEERYPYGAKRRGSLTPEKNKIPDGEKKIPKKVRLGNNDEQEVGKLDIKVDYLKFESRFESGNLRKAVQIADKEYDLYLMSDVNSGTNTQWFYFQVSNVVENVPYTFNIVNCVKSNSQFNYGMQPVVFSVAEALDGKAGWVRSGVNVCYHKNGFHQGNGRKTFYSASFSIVFHRRGDICYIAYHYPYPYTRLLVEIWKLLKKAKEKGKVCARYDVLCESLNKNEVPLLTITAPNNSETPLESREIVVFTARVHPGEPNASWMMHGVLHHLLLGPNMENILNRFIFKIIPMLNVEGVINGCSRNGLTGEDLNRRWKNPNATLHPSIFNAKGMIEHCIRLRDKTPILYCDLHGHSRKKNAFVYGCSYAKSWSSVDRNQKQCSTEYLTLPEAMSRRTATFSTQYCNYEVKKGRESTARVALWRDFGITRSYTLEASYCGCDRGLYKGQSMGIGQLIECGEALAQACEELLSEDAECQFDAPAVPYPTPNQSNINLVNSTLDSRYRSTNTKGAPKPRKPGRRVREGRLKSKAGDSVGVRKRASSCHNIVTKKQLNTL